MIAIEFGVSDSTVGEALEGWRKWAGGGKKAISQREAAARADVSQFVWSVYERNGMKDVTLDVAKKLIAVTAGSPHAITLDMFPPPKVKGAA